MKVIEACTHAKAGDEAKNEDRWLVTEHFAAVIDGATAKEVRSYDGLSAGRFIARRLAGALEQLPADSTAQDALSAFSHQLLMDYDRLGLREYLRANPGCRPNASFAIYSKHRRECWLVGDCRVLMEGALTAPSRKVDQVLANTRAFVLEAALQAGSTLAELAQADPGRAFIAPLLLKQGAFQNNLDAGDLCLAPGALSFDDRSYLRLDVSP